MMEKGIGSGMMHAQLSQVSTKVWFTIVPGHPAAGVLLAQAAIPSARAEHGMRAKMASMPIMATAIPGRDCDMPTLSLLARSNSDGAGYYVPGVNSSIFTCD
jgi:hypothetical protein